MRETTGHIEISQGNYLIHSTQTKASNFSQQLARRLLKRAKALGIKTTTGRKVKVGQNYHIKMIRAWSTASIILTA